MFQEQLLHPFRVFILGRPFFVSRFNLRNPAVDLENYMQKRQAPGSPASIIVPGNSYFFMASSKAMADGGKLMRRTNSSDSLAPNSRSMPLSSHSTDRGPL